MSGVGKSYWARQLARHGYTHLDCDAMIAQRLGDIVTVNADEDPVHAVGRWLGMPWSEGYPQREAKYLALESDVTQQAIAQVNDEPDRPAVIDTTGSVIYTGDALLEKLKRSTRVVYFDVPDDVQQRMVDLYLAEPKPVLWQGGFRHDRDEPHHEALMRCYANLLADRADRYRALADVVLDYQVLRGGEAGVEMLLAMINI